MKKIIGIVITIILLLTFSSCDKTQEIIVTTIAQETQTTHETSTITTQEIIITSEETSQDPQMIYEIEYAQEGIKFIYANGNFTPTEGANNEQAKNLIKNYFTNNEYSENIINNIDVKEITTQKLWQNNQTQIFAIKSVNDQNYISFFIVKNNEIIINLISYNVKSIFIEDINKDGSYEIFIVESMGSGILTSHIQIFDIKNNKNYISTPKFGNGAMYITINENKIVECDFNKIPIGTLKLTNVQILDNNYLLEIEPIS